MERSQLEILRRMCDGRVLHIFGNHGWMHSQFPDRAPDRFEVRPLLDLKRRGFIVCSNKGGFADDGEYVITDAGRAACGDNRAGA